MVGAETSPTPEQIVHASCAALNDQAVLVRGASGTGKSSLVLELMSRGALLVADDRTCLRMSSNRVVAFSPDPLLGMIEARYVGLLRAQPAAPTPVTLVVDLDQVEAKRIPEVRTCNILGQSIALLHKSETPHFAAAVLQYLKSGLWTET